MDERIFLLIIDLFRAHGGSSLLKKGHFSAAFSSNETQCTLFFLLSSIGPRKEELRTVTEIGQK